MGTGFWDEIEVVVFGCSVLIWAGVVDPPDTEVARLLGFSVPTASLVGDPLCSFSETAAPDTTSTQRNANRTRLNRRERKAGGDVLGDTLAEEGSFIRRITAC